MSSDSTQEAPEVVEARPRNELIRAALAEDADAIAHLERHGDDITKLMAKA
jgi:hypothetical protein